MTDKVISKNKSVGISMKTLFNITKGFYPAITFFLTVSNEAGE